MSALIGQTVKSLLERLKAGLGRQLADHELQLLLREASEEELYQARLHLPVVDSRSHAEIHARMKTLREARMDGFAVGEWVTVPGPAALAETKPLSLGVAQVTSTSITVTGKAKR